MDKDQLKQELINLADGLLIPTTKAPLEFYYHEKPEDQDFSEQLLAKWAGKPAGKEVETMELNQFLDRILDSENNEEPINEDEFERFRHLSARIQELLQDVKVYLIEELGQEVFIIGRTENNDFAGYKTIIVDIDLGM